MGPVEFLTELWGPAPPGYIQTWELARKRSSYWHLPANLMLGAAVDLYHAVGLSQKRLPAGQRTKATQVVALPGLWADIDIAPEGRAMRSPADAHALAASILEPTLLVDSGHGIHAYYLFTGGPWVFTSRADQDAGALLAAQLQALLRRRADAAGGGLDHTHDLARILRLPGTTNAKDPSHPRPVRVTVNDGPRHDRANVAELCATAGPVLQPAQRTDGDGHASTVEPVSGISEDTLRLVGALCANDDEFADAWHHVRRGNRARWTGSEWDLSIVARGVHAGLTDQQLAALITANRLHHDPTDTKHQRGRYVQQTIALARAGNQRQAVVDRARAQLKAA